MRDPHSATLVRVAARSRRAGAPFAAPLFAAAGTLLLLAAPLAIPTDPPIADTIAPPSRPVLQQVADSDFLVGRALADPGVADIPPIVDVLIYALPPTVLRAWTSTMSPSSLNSTSISPSAATRPMPSPPRDIGERDIWFK